jgi:hypothetical protein
MLDERNALPDVKPNVSTEMAINVLACNMKRVMALVGVSALAAMITP